MATTNELNRAIATVHHYENEYGCKFNDFGAWPEMNASNEIQLRDWSESARKANELAGIKLF